MYANLALLLTAAAGFGGYIVARNFVRRRLRFVDAVQSPWAPWIAGACAGLVVAPLTLLPLVGAASAVIFAIAIGLGTASGARAIRRGEVLSRRLIP